MKFEFKINIRGISDEDLLSDLRRCATDLGRDTTTIKEYKKNGRFDPSTIQRRFGSWPRALERAGLKPSRSPINISHDELMENLKTLLVHHGRQPTYRDVNPKLQVSKFSASTYTNHYVSWNNALAAFEKWLNQEEPSAQEGGEYGFRCKACGASN